MTSSTAPTTRPTRSTVASTCTRSQTAPLINHYSKMGLLAVVNGVGHPDHVFKRVCDAVDERR